MRLAIWDFDGTLAERPGLWSQCLADLANRHTGQGSHRREDFVPYLKIGFPWHTPERAHTVMIGDSQEADVEGAEALGIRAFLVRKPNPRCEGQVSQLMHIAEALLKRPLHPAPNHRHPIGQ